MTIANLTTDIPPKPYGQGGRYVVLPQSANAVIYQGAMVAETAAGALVTGTTAGSGHCVGVAVFGQTGGATDGAVRMQIWTDKIFCFAAGTYAPTDATPFGTVLWMESDNQVGTGIGTETQIAGRFYGFEDDGTIRVYVSARASWFDANANTNDGGTAAFKARAVMTSLGANTGTTTGTLTITATGALAAQDGVTPATGDRLWIQEGTTNLAAASDAGLWLVANAGGTGVHAVLTRPPEWQTGAVMIAGQQFEIGGEGTLWAGTQWKSFAAKGSVVDTTAPLFFVREVSQAVALVASTFTLSNVGIRSATKSAVFAQFQAAGGTVTNTVGYGVIAAPTPGAIGTASAVIDALASGMTKNGTADTSTVVVTVINW
jgi:hypothetical protein